MPKKPKKNKVKGVHFKWTVKPYTKIKPPKRGKKSKYKRNKKIVDN